MATTPVFGWRYQTLADPPNGATLGEHLALDAEATVNGQASSIATLQNGRARLIARGRRTTNQTSTGTESGVIRLDDIPILSGRGYRIYTSTLNLSPSVVDLAAEARIRITTDGSTPSASSTQIGMARVEAAATFVPVGSSICATEYYPAGNETLSVWFGWILIGGAGTATLLGATTSPVSIYVEDMGVDVGTGFATVL